MQSSYSKSVTVATSSTGRKLRRRESDPLRRESGRGHDRRYRTDKLDTTATKAYGISKKTNPENIERGRLRERREEREREREREEDESKMRRLRALVLVAEAELKELNRKPSSSPKAERKEDVEKRHAGVNEDLVARFGKFNINSSVSVVDDPMEVDSKPTDSFRGRA